MKIFVSGLTSVETTLGVRGFPVTYYPVDYPFFGINTAVAGSGFRTATGSLALGDDVDFVTLIGDDFNGARVLDAFDRYGLSNRFVYKKLQSTVASVVLQETPYGRRQLYCDLKDAQEQTVDALLHEDAIRSSDVCALLNVNYSRPFIPIAKKLGKKIATDVQALADVDDEFNAEFIENADILFLSDEGISTAPRKFIEKLALKTKAEVIIMGLGEDGAMFIERGNGVKTLKSVSAPNVLTAGAGAALMSAFLHYYGKYDCVGALKRAEAFVALKLEGNTQNGGFPTEKEVEQKFLTAEF